MRIRQTPLLLILLGLGLPAGSCIGGGEDPSSTPPEQHGHLDLADFRKALIRLSPDQREALLLVGAEGFSYEEAAEISGCAVGTVKSRVNRARGRLAQLMSIGSVQDLAPERASQGIVMR